MGTWGLGTFEDDIACDWLEDLYDSDPIPFFSHCLDLTGLEDLEFLACIGVVCSAEIIQALLREPRDGLPKVVYLWLDEYQNLNVFPLLADAIEGLRRVISPDSEMHEFWEDEAENYDAWLNHVSDLIHRLQLARADHV